MQVQLKGMVVNDVIGWVPHTARKERFMHKA